MIVLWILIAVLALAIIILIHELGHFFASKAVGVKVLQFSIGFGPEIVGWDRGETRYSIKWFLAGGSVRIFGMNPDEEVPPEEFSRSYYGVTYWKRAVIVLAGSFAHLLMAMLCFYLIFWPLGVPTPTGRIEKAEKTIEISGKDVKTPAAEIGLKNGDLVTKVDGVRVYEWADLQDELSKRPGQTVTLEVERNGKTATYTTKLLSVDGRGVLGVQVDLNDTTLKRSNPATAVWRSTEVTGRLSVLLAKGLASIFSVRTLKVLIGTEDRTVSSPRSIVGAAQLTAQAARRGAADFLAMLGQIFLFLAIFNLIPLPPFDGGHLAVIVIEKVSGKRVDMRKLMPLAWVVIVVLSLVALRLAYLDVFQPLPMP